jgi:xylan 1,4-beta-xylosidase
MKGLLDLAAKNKVNLIGMVSWSFEFEDKPYFEGFRTLATNGIDKPVLNIFRMAGLLSGNRVEATSSAQVSVDAILKDGVHESADIDAFATADTHQAAVMLWNYSDDDLAAPAAEVSVKISGLPATVHRVLLEHFRIDDTHSNAYTAWKAMGSPQSPTQEQYLRLKAAGQLELLNSPEWLDVTASSVTVSTELPRQATSLLHLEW